MKHWTDEERALLCIVQERNLLAAIDGKRARNCQVSAFAVLTVHVWKNLFEKKYQSVTVHEKIQTRIQGDLANGL